MLHRVLGIALLAGVAAGLVVTAVELLWTVPIILDAEVYEHFGGILPEGGFEVAKAQMLADDAAAGASESIWQRHGITAIANVLLGVGAALVLSGLFNLLGHAGLKRGLLWGLGAFLVVAAAPALGLPPELPGTIAAELSARQSWWLATAALTAAGLAAFAYGPSWPWKIAGLALIAAPHVYGAPHPEVYDAVAPVALEHEFIAASLFSSAVFWVVLGLGVGLLAQRFGQQQPAGEAASA